MSPSYSKPLKLLSDSDPSNRIKAVRELGNLKADECISDILRAVESDEDDDVKLEAVIALGRIGDTSVGDKLLNQLDSKDIPFLMETVNTLGILAENGFTAAIDPLENMIEYSNFRVRKLVIEALGKAGSSTTIEKLFTYLKTDKVAIELKELCATAIGQIGGARAIQILRNLIIPNDEIPELIMEVRRAAIYSLGESRNEVALEVLKKVFSNKDEDKVIRKYAEEALKKTIEGAKARYLRIKKRAEDILKGK
jgi:HEAT repeat protein